MNENVPQSVLNKRRKEPLIRNSITVIIENVIRVLLEFFMSFTAFILLFVTVIQMYKGDALATLIYAGSVLLIVFSKALLR